MKSKKGLLFTLCAVLLITASVIGTVAYLTASSDEVKNTFAVGKLLETGDKFVLREHKAVPGTDGVYTLDEQTEVTENAYAAVLPGVDLPKDPFVKTEKALALDAYVFIEVLDKTGTALTAEVDTDNWTLLTGVTPKTEGAKVYRLKANNGVAVKGEALGPVRILKNDRVVVANDPVSDAAAQFGGSITFNGYMIQTGGFENAAQAWTKGFAPEKD